MATAPYGVRLLVGAATIAVEETVKLPQTILTYPMTLASQAAHLVMLFQQNLAELAIKGDATLESWFPPKDEQPPWATFDEDSGEPDDVNNAGSDSTSSADDGDRYSEGRFALYSLTDPPTEVPQPASTPPGGSAPQVAIELGYQTLTLAQLRARLQSLSIVELRDLLAYEEETKSRAPFRTLLANRITRVSAK